MISTMAERWAGAGVPSGSALWGGRAAGTKSSLSRPSAEAAYRAEAACPRWGGLKVPP